MKKRIVSVVCVILLVFSICALPTVIAAEEEGVSSDGKNLVFAKALGFIDEAKTGESEFTRFELAKLVAKILMYDAAEPQIDGVSGFYDVTDEMHPYVETAVRAGIMRGVGDGSFRPEDKVTYIQFLTTMVSLLGRTQMAETYGGYPHGYYSVAKSIGIAKEAPSNLEYSININGVANVLKQMVNCDVMYFDNLGYLKSAERSYLEYYCGIEIETGTVQGAGGVSLSRERSDFDVLVIGDEKFYGDEESNFTDELIGCEADVFYREKNGKNNILYVDCSKSETLTVDAVDIKEVTDKDIVYYHTAAKTKKLSIGNKTTVIYNGEILGNFGAEELNPFFGTSLDGRLLLTDTEGDGVFDTVNVTAYKSYVVSYTDDDGIYCKYGGAPIEKDLIPDKGVVNVLMQPIELDSVEEGDVIHVMTGKSGNINRIIVTIDAVSGVVQSTESENGIVTAIEIMDKWYDCSDILSSSQNAEKIKAGAVIKLYFNPEGRICEVDESGSDGYTAGYLIDAKKASGLNDDYLMKLLISNGNIATYTLADKVSVKVGAADEVQLKADAAIAAAGETDGRVTRQPVFFSLDLDGMITKIKYRNLDDGTDTDGFYQYENFDGETSLSSYFYRPSAMSFGAKMLLGAQSLIFAVAPEENRDDDSYYYLYPISSLRSEYVTRKIEAYGTKANNPVADILVIKGEKGGSGVIDQYTDILVVDSMVTAENDDGREVTRIKGYMSGKETYADAYSESIADVIPGDIIRYSLDNDGIINNIEKIFSFENKALASDLSNPSQSNLYSNPRYSYGTVYYADDYAFTVEIDKGEDGFLYECYPIYKFKIVCVDTSGRRLETYTTSDITLLNKCDYGDAAYKVFIYTASGDCKTIVIYK